MQRLDLFKFENNIYRLLDYHNSYYTIIQMNTTKLEIICMEASCLDEMNIRNIIEYVIEDKEIIDETCLSEKQIQERNKRYALMLKVLDAYPDLSELKYHYKDSNLSKIFDVSGVSYTTFLRYIRIFLQSGFDKNSLIPKRGKIKSPIKYANNKCLGRKSNNNRFGILRTKEVCNQFDDAIKYYTTGKSGTLTGAYHWMCNKYYRKQNDNRLSINYDYYKCPSKNQFFYYTKKTLTEKDKIIARTNERKFHNDRRLLKSDVFKIAKYAGQQLEVDECELPIKIISSIDSNKSAGSPVLYIFIDSYSKMIVAYYLGFENNSLNGFRSLFHNLAEDKKEIAKQYGYNDFDSTIIPYNFLPESIIADRGSEYTSKEIKEILKPLNITLQLATGATGSYKPNVERVFKSLQDYLKEYKPSGYYDKNTYGNPNKNACLTLDELRKLVFEFICNHNKKYMKDYKQDQDMFKAGIDTTPTSIWDYSCKVFGHPRPIPNIQQFEYDLLKDIQIKITRNIIEYKKMFYYTDDKYVNELALKVKSGSHTIEAKIDPRNVNKIYFTNKNTGKVCVAELNPDKKRNEIYFNHTLKEVDDINAEFNRRFKKGQETNELNDLVTFRNTSQHIKQAKKAVISITKTQDIKQTRNDSKQSIAFSESLKSQKNLCNNSPEKNSSVEVNDALNDHKSKVLIQFLE